MSVIIPLEKISGYAQFEQKTITFEPILHLLETAVWAPNDGLREPWRFLFVEVEHQRKALPLHHEAPAHLVVIATAAGEEHKQAEDLAAVYCLIQNLKLLCLDQHIGVNVHIKDWMYERILCESLGIRDNERIAAILDIGYMASHDATDADPFPTLRISEC
ncbi:hypothetical protein [Paenibacillus sinopodophylli]|uniref:hypothetical protein n=1 Tax=Paenibacillus sinopodophylli TaxID=1837342 RepID=UPI0014862E76|nr:hypothetical protein [Paenibacillus sinopodophylli]